MPTLTRLGSRQGVPTLVAVSEEAAGLYPRPTSRTYHRPLLDTCGAALVVALTASGALALGWHLGVSEAAASCNATIAHTWSLDPPYRRSLTSADGLATWLVRSRNGTISVPANIPGVAHEALLAAGVLSGDLMYRTNERAMQWVALEDWTFEASFVLHPAVDHALLGGGSFGAVNTR